MRTECWRSVTAEAAIASQVRSSLCSTSLDWSIASLYRSGKVVSAPGQGVKRICGRDVLSNDGVNLVSAMLAALLTGTVAWYWVSLSIGTS